MYILTDMSEDLSNDMKIPKRNPTCFGCGCHIRDQFILRVAPDLEWHATCLKCFECGQYLDESCTCFVRNGKTYCKLDYFRLFSKRCARCKDLFNKNDFVMRANSKIYHLDCFRCCICNKQLAPGDEFLLRDEELFCKVDSEVLGDIKQNCNSPAITAVPTQISTTCQNITNLQAPPNSNNNNNKMHIKCENLGANNEYDSQNCAMSPQHLQMNGSLGSHHQPPTNRIMSYHHLSGSLNQNSNPNLANSLLNGIDGITSTLTNQTANQNNHGNNNNNNNTHHHHHHRKDKTTRVRTVLNEKQLHTLRACYGANPRPDALMKEQLVEMTGLSPRVIRVWFQNKRCKDKKKSILIKQMQEQQKNRQSIGHGIPMIASSPMQNDINNLGSANQVDIQSGPNIYQQNGLTWKQMTEYSLNGQSNQDLNRLNNNSLGYEQVMGFGSDEDDCFDNLSDQNGEDSVSSMGMDDTRIQQL